VALWGQRVRWWNSAALDIASRRRSAAKYGRHLGADPVLYLDSCRRLGLACPLTPPQ
jgi:hypothetical protein